MSGRTNEDIVVFTVKGKDVRDKLYKFLSVASRLFNDAMLTDREIELLVEALLLDREKFRHARFSRQAKKLSIKNLKENWGRDLNISSYNGFMYSIMNKGYIIRDEDSVLYVVPTLEKVTEMLQNGTLKLLFSFEDEKDTNG